MENSMITKIKPFLEKYHIIEPKLDFNLFSLEINFTPEEKSLIQEELKSGDTININDYFEEFKIQSDLMDSDYYPYIVKSLPRITHVKINENIYKLLENYSSIRTNLENSLILESKIEPNLFEKIANTVNSLLNIGAEFNSSNNTENKYLNSLYKQYSYFESFIKKGTSVGIMTMDTYQHFLCEEEPFNNMKEGLISSTIENL